MKNRNHTARMAQAGACNPIPLASGLQRAIQEMRDADADTTQILEDPACRLIVHQLAYLFKIDQINGGHAEYCRLTNAIEEAECPPEPS
jgi:hypothetical protein